MTPSDAGTGGTGRATGECTGPTRRDRTITEIFGPGDRKPDPIAPPTSGGVFS